MTTSTSNRRNNNIDDTTMDAGHGRIIGNLVTLDYPSLIGHSWDDELLPSGD